MKTVSLLLVAFLSLCMVIPTGAQVHVGVLGGLNLANMSMDPGEGADLSRRTVFGLGLVVDFSLGDNSALHLEPMYIQKGSVRTADGVDNEIKMAYFELPLILRYDIGTGNIKPYVMAGPTFGFNLSAKVKEIGGDVEDMKNDVKSVDFGFGIGAGVRLPMGRNYIFVESRYAIGVADINDAAGGLKPIVKTNGIQMFAGFTFPLHGE